MDPIGSFQGLATGIDFRELVDAIIAAEARPAVLLNNRKTDLDKVSTAWGDVRLRVQSMHDRAAELAEADFFNTFKTSVSGDGISASAGSDAVPGTFSVEVLQLATREKVGSNVFQARNEALALAGEFVVAGQAVTVASTDTLDDVAQSINAAASRALDGGATATVVGGSAGGYSIVLTAADSGARGVQLSDGADGVLTSLGFVDSTRAIKNQTSDGATSDGFRSAAADIATLLGLSTPPASSSVTIGALAVTIDLADDSLDDIAAAINTAAAGAGSSITAQVVAGTDDDGATVRRLDIDGTTSFVDSNGILETLGVLEAGRGAVAQEIGGAAFTAGDAVTPATGATLLSDLWVDGASASIQAGDSFTVQGTRGDGSTFTKTLVVDPGDTYQDLVDELNSATDGYQAVTSTATASIVDGTVVVTDDEGGASRLGLSIISNNEGGGTLDFGDFSTLTVGRAREITAGLDAEMLIDGAYHTRSKNSVSDVVEGVSLDLTSVSEDGPLTVGIERDTDAIVTGVEDFVKAFNSVSEFVLGQFTGVGAEEGKDKRPLSGDQQVRRIRNEMREILQTTLSSTVSSLGNLRELGLESNRQGLFDIDKAKLTAAVENSPLAVQRLFTEFGSGSVSSLDYVSAGSAAEVGTYDVLVSTPASRAAATGTGFGGTYVDDGTADTLTITDSSTGSVFGVDLSNGMTLTDVIDALNAEFAMSTARQLEGGVVLKSDAVGTDATDDTLLQDLYDSGGTSLGIANGDTFTFSGVRDDGSSFLKEWTVADISSQTLGSLRDQIADAIGIDVVVDVVNGTLSATSIEDGSGTFTLAVSSDNAGAGTFSMGSLGVVEAGRGKGTLSAVDGGGELSIVHDEYGSNAGFSLAFAAGGTDGSASLGLTAGDYAGMDVVGTIGGHAATGNGRLLTGDEGTAVEGLVVSYAGTDIGAIGSLNFSRGIGSLMETLTDGYLDGGDSSIQGIVDRIDTQKRRIDDRIERFQERLELREENLIKRFAALEEAMAQAQQEQSWLQAQMTSLLAS